MTRHDVCCSRWASGLPTLCIAHNTCSGGAAVQLGEEAAAGQADIADKHISRGWVGRMGEGVAGHVAVGGHHCTCTLYVFAEAGGEL